MGTHHLQAIGRGSGLELVGIVERAPSLQASLAERYQVPCRGTTDALLELVAADCALVCTPDHLHATDALRCLRSGLHALVEKPLCPSLRQAESLVEAFRREGRILAGGLVERHNPAWRVFLEHVAEVGEPLSLEIHRSGRTPSRRESGVLRDLAIHDLDLLWQWLGPIALERREAGDPSLVVLRGASLPSISLVARWDDSPPARHWVFQGKRGRLVLDLQRRTLGLSRPDGTARGIEVPRMDPLEREHRQFAAAIRGEIDPQELEVRRQLDVLAFCEALEPAGSSRPD